MKFLKKQSVALGLALSFVSSFTFAINEYRVPLRGLHIAAPGILSTPTALDFGSVNVGASASKTLTITNTGTAALFLSNVQPSSGGLVATAAPACASIAPAGTCTINVTFQPASAGPLSSAVSFDTNTTNGKITIPATGTAISESDPAFAQVKLLLPLGANGGLANSTDIKSHVMTAGPNFAASTGVIKFGTSAGQFGYNAQISTPYTADFQFPGDFTMESWIYVTSVDAKFRYAGGGNSQWDAKLIPIIGQGNSDSGSGASASTASNFDWLYDTTQNTFIFMRRTGSGNTGQAVYRSNAVSLPLNTWHHVAVARTGSTLSFFLDGAVVGSVTLAGNLNATGTLPVVVGRAMGGNDDLYYWFNGYMQDVRITNGVARYTGNYVVPSKPYPLN